MFSELPLFLLSDPLITRDAIFLLANNINIRNFELSLYAIWQLICKNKTFLCQKNRKGQAHRVSLKMSEETLHFYGCNCSSISELKNVVHTGVIQGLKRKNTLQLFKSLSLLSAASFGGF